MWLFTALSLAAPPTDAPAVPPPEPIDVAALFEGLPGEGLTRCRSEQPDVAYLSHRYTGGPQPYPGMVVRSSRLFIDGELVEAIQEREGEAPAARAIRIEVVPSEVVSPARQAGVLVTTSQRVRLSRADGSPLAGKPVLELVWDCETALHPPRP